MVMSPGQRARSASRPDEMALPAQGMLLALDVADAAQRLPQAAAGWSVVVARFALLGRPLLDRVAPDVVAFPLFGPGYDALQVVERLVALGYGGRMACVTEPLPAPEMVRGELQALAGGPLWLVVRPS